VLFQAEDLININIVRLKTGSEIKKSTKLELDMGMSNRQLDAGHNGMAPSW